MIVVLVLMVVVILVVVKVMMVVIIMMKVMVLVYAHMQPRHGVLRIKGIFPFLTWKIKNIKLHI